MFQVAYKSDIGLKRTTNQDAISIREDLGLFLVADGMGGYKGGEIASQMTAEAVEAFLNESDAFETVELWLIHAIESANRQVYLKALDEPDYKGMGTTCSLILLKNNQIHLAHVGDSRIYFVKDDKIEQVTIDHTLVEDLIARGEISRSEAKLHPKRNVITRAVGTDTEIKIDYACYDEKSADVILICSDGLTGKINDQEILEIINTKPIEKAVDALVNLANDRGGSDNISIIIMAMSN